MSAKIPTIKNLQKEAWEIAEYQGFHKGIEPASRDGLMIRLGLVHTEVSEAFQVVKKQWQESENQEARAHFEEELADIVIRVLDIAGSCNIDLEGAIEAKMRINKMRPYRYGTPDEGKREGT